MRAARSVARGGLVAALLGGTGCFATGVPPRTGVLVAPGRIGGGGHVTLFAFSPGSFTASDGLIFEGNASKQAGGGLTATTLPWLFGMTQGTLAYGLDRSREIDFLLGGAGTGLELRQRILAEASGAPLSLAAALGVTSRPLVDTRRPWGRAGLDLSRELGTTSLFGNIHLTYGPERHAIEASLLDRCDDPGARCRAFEPAPYFLARTTELRGQLAFGFTTRERAGERPGHGLEFTMAFAPYATLWRPREEASCRACGGAAGPAAFSASFGGSVVLGFVVLPKR